MKEHVRGLVAVVTATLALGDRANTAIFSAAWAVLQGPAASSPARFAGSSRSSA